MYDYLCYLVFSACLKPHSTCNPPRRRLPSATHWALLAQCLCCCARANSAEPEGLSSAQPGTKLCGHVVSVVTNMLSHVVTQVSYAPSTSTPNSTQELAIYASSCHLHKGENSGSSIHHFCSPKDMSCRGSFSLSFNPYQRPSR